MATNVHVESCGFFRLGCRSGHELFAASYTRSNKKRSAKLLRCFPHCCPDHVPRSYCGCSIHLLVTFASVEDAAAADQNEDLVVCARFETAATMAVTGVGDAVTAMPPNAMVALPAKALQKSGSKTMESDWVRAEKASDVYQQQFPQNTKVYVLNNHRTPKWYYGFESGSTKAQRDMKHVLAAYVFVLHPMPERRPSTSDHQMLPPAARLATVVTRQASPPFTMMSYRRQNDVRRQAQERTATEAATVAMAVTARASLQESSFGSLRSGATSASGVVSDQGARLKSNTSVDGQFDQYDDDPYSDENDRERGGRDSSNATEILLQTDAREQALVQVPLQAPLIESDQATLPAPPSLPMSILRQPQPFARPPANCCPICCGLLTSHPLRLDTMEHLQQMLLLQLFLRFVPLDAFSFYFSPMDFRIQRRWLAKIPPVNLSRRAPNAVPDTAFDVAARTLVADIASAFSLVCFLPSEQGLSAQGVTMDTAPALVTTDRAREQMVLRTCADLMLDAFSSLRVQQILTSIASVETRIGVETNTRGQISSRATSALCEQFSQVVADLYDELTQMLTARSNNDSQFGQLGRLGHSCRNFNGNVSVSELVDDILSLVYAEPRYRCMRDAASALLLRKGATLEVAAQQMYCGFVAWVHQLQGRGSRWEAVDGQEAPTYPVRGISATAAQSRAWEPMQIVDPNDVWNRRWFLVSPSVSVIPLGAELDGSDGSVHVSPPACKTGPSLLDVVAFIRMFGCVDMALEGASLSVKAAMNDASIRLPSSVLREGRTIDSSMELDLDGQIHAFDSFPNGLPSLVAETVFGTHWGASVYKGFVSDDKESMDLLLFSLPPSSTRLKREGPQQETRRAFVTSTEITETMHRFRIKLGLEKATRSAGAREDCLSVFVEISCAQNVLSRIGRSDLYTNPTERLFESVSVFPWCPTTELGATFVASPYL